MNKCYILHLFKSYEEYFNGIMGVYMSASQSQLLSIIIYKLFTAEDIYIYST